MILIRRACFPIHTYHRMEQFEDELPRGGEVSGKKQESHMKPSTGMMRMEGERSIGRHARQPRIKA